MADLAVKHAFRMELLPELYMIVPQCEPGMTSSEEMAFALDRSESIKRPDETEQQ